jgi:hypothetical protein
MKKIKFVAVALTFVLSFASGAQAGNSWVDPVNVVSQLEATGKCTYRKVGPLYGCYTPEGELYSQKISVGSAGWEFILIYELNGYTCTQQNTRESTRCEQPMQLKMKE